MEKSALDQFGSEFIERTRDNIIEQYLMIKSGEMRSEDAQKLFKIISSLKEAQQQQLDTLVLDVIERALHEFMFMFEDTDNWAIIQKETAENLRIEHLAEISDGLSGELYGNGWIKKFSKYKPDSMEEK